MKKICLSLLLLIFFHSLSIGQDVYIYNSKGDKIYFNKTGKNVIRIENISDTNTVKEIKRLDSNAIVLTNQLVISDINTSRISTFSAKSSISTTDLLSVGEDFYWVEKNGIILKVKPGIDVDTLLNLNNIGYKKREQLGSDENVFIVELQNGYDAISICNSLFESGNVVFAQPNWGMYGKFVQNDKYSYQWNLHTNSAYDINVEAAWNLAEGEGIKVAVLDEGVELTHPDLVTNLLPGYDVVDAPQVGAEGSNKAIDDHGTRCAGIIAASDNNIGIKGIAYKSKIIPIRIGHSDSNDSRYWETTSTGIVRAITYAWDTAGADILSNSWSHSGDKSEAIYNEINRAIQYGRGGKGCVVAFAAGNNDSNEVRYPSYLPNVISVGAMSPCGERKSPASCDGETSWGSNYGSGLNVVAPGVLIPTTDINSGYVNNFNGTSAACPHVAGVAALMLSANPNLTSAQVKNIIEQTAKKIRPDLYVYSDSSIYPNGTWNNQVGYGLVDAYAAVTKAMDVDLYISDTTGDNGAENLALKYMWNSPDIWIEDLDGNTVNNPVEGGEYKVCVRIHNKSNIPSTGNERLFLNWAKAGINLPWPNGWNGSRTIDCDGEKYMSGSIGNSNGIIISEIIQPNSFIEKKISWYIPLSEDFNCGIFAGSEELWHFCLLARVHDSDTIIGENLNSYPIDTFVTLNNNVAWKNLTVIEGSNNRAVVWLQNHFNTAQKFRLHFTAHPNSKNESLSKYAETYIRLSPNVFKAWTSGGKKGNGISVVDENRLRITSDNATLENIPLPANAVGMLETEVNFLSEAIPQDKTFTFDIAMYDANGKTLYGGEHYMAIRDDKRTFDVVAMQNQTAMPEESVTFNAVNIGEPATYVWYNAAGDSIASGTTLSTTATQSQQYRLSVQATADGYKGYDTVSLVVRNAVITSLSPNPATNQVVVSYSVTNQVQSGTVQIANTNGIVLSSTPFTAPQTSTTLNLQNLTAGQYNVRLVSSTGEVMDTKTLIVQ